MPGGVDGENLAKRKLELGRGGWLHKVDEVYCVRCFLKNPLDTLKCSLLTVSGSRYVLCLSQSRLEEARWKNGRKLARSNPTTVKIHLALKAGLHAEYCMMDGYQLTTTSGFLMDHESVLEGKRSDLHGVKSTENDKISLDLR